MDFVLLVLALLGDIFAPLFADRKDRECMERVNTICIRFVVAVLVICAAIFFWPAK